MLYLKIENGKAYFIDGSNKYQEIDQITKDDILRLLDCATSDDTQFDMTEYDEDSLHNEVHRIIYKELYFKFRELINDKDRFLDESESLYKEALNKYAH